jgi:hypothetical protein
MTIRKLDDVLDSGEVDLDESQVQTIRQRLAAIQGAMEAAPKSLAWKMRAKVGTRVRWYEEVEEVQR